MAVDDAHLNRWEVGSEFDWNCDLLINQRQSVWPSPHVLFESARAALRAIVIPPGVDTNRSTLHIPAYFCRDVIESISKYMATEYYCDLPSMPYPNFDTLQPRPGDYVLAVNYFGVRESPRWYEWHSQHEDVVLIEDHSHDPLSDWSKQSKADYVVASLRKTLPIPDGAILWSPRGHALPRPRSQAGAAPYLKFGAMVLKHLYLEGSDIAKHEFRKLAMRGEELFKSSRDATASPMSSQALRLLDVEALQRKRQSNVQYLLMNIPWSKMRGIEALFTTWPIGAAPFNVIVKCSTVSVRDDLRRYLIENRVYCPVHWPITTSVTCLRAQELSKRLLTIPADHRYSFDDMDRVADIIGAFTVSSSI